MEALGLEVIRAVLKFPRMVKVSLLLRPEEVMLGLLALDVGMIGLLHPSPCQSEGEVKTAGRCCLELHLWADGRMLELFREM